MKKIPLSKWCAVASLLLLIPLPSPGAMVLDFNLPGATPTDVDFGNYDGTSRSYDLQTGNVWRINFDSTSSGRFFNNPWSTSTTNVPWFSGGLEGIANNPTHDTNLFMWRQGNVASPRKVDIFGFDSTGSPDEGFTSHGIFLWDQTQFINGGEAGASLEATSSLTLHYNDFNSQVADSQIRFLVQSGGQYYLSQTAITNGVYGGETFTLTDAGTEDWAIFNPSPTAFTITGTEVYNVSLTNAPITQVGIAFTCGRPQYAGGFSFDTFSADLEPIPEPAAWAGLLLLAGLTAATRRRQDRQP